MMPAGEKILNGRGEIIMRGLIKIGGNCNINVATRLKNASF